MKNLKELITTYYDYPKKGIEFKDVLGIIQEPKIFKELIVEMSSSQIIKNSEAIISAAGASMSSILLSINMTF